MLTPRAGRVDLVLPPQSGVGAAAGKDAYSAGSNKTGQPKPPRSTVYVPCSPCGDPPTVNGANAMAQAAPTPQGVTLSRAAFSVAALGYRLLRRRFGFCPRSVMTGGLSGAPGFHGDWPACARFLRRSFSAHESQSVG